MIFTTLTAIREHAPCSSGWAKLLAGLGKTAPDDEPLPFTRIVEINGFEDALWACMSAPQHSKQWRLFAAWCARQVQHLMTDARSIAAIDVAERHAYGKATNDELIAASDAAWDAASDAAWDAAWAAAWAAASDAASDAAWDAAWSAALAAASDAARAAAWDAAWAAALAAASDAARAAAWDAAWAAAWAAASDAARAAQEAQFIAMCNEGLT